jgi:peptide chain release factor 3
VGVVGPLQLEVLGARILKEYNVPITFESLNFEVARWIESDDPEELKRFIAVQKTNIAEDRTGAPVFLAQNAWWADRAKQDFPKLRFMTTKERH